MKRNRLTVVQLIIVAFLILCNRSFTQEILNFDNVEVFGVSKSVMCLDGIWKFSTKPPTKFWEQEINQNDWRDIQVPGECAMQGFPIKHDVPYVYKTRISIPYDYNNKIVKLKFDGVYSFSRVWINGIFIRDHKGGFTTWECDITDYVTAGNNADLTVEIIDKKDDISYGSGYAKHQIGGILRSVWLLALPQNNMKYINIETDLDDNYKNAKLKIDLKTSDEEKAFVMFELYDSEGNKVDIGTNRYPIINQEQTISIDIINPKKWNAEHPNLYTLKTMLSDEYGNVTYSKAQKIGFREVEVIGNKMLVNGKPVKLRGACRHDIHPLLGRMSTPEYDKKDVLLAKEANMNFIRTSHYPPSESFLNYCDEYGIYVEDESAVCFVNTHRSAGYRELKQSGPKFEGQYLSQVKEMVHFHRNHPSVIIWSIGNESKYDKHLQKSYDYIKTVDSTRPVISSYPGLVPDSAKCYDILSMHYPSYTGNMSPQYGIGIKKFEYQKMPALFDEWAHVACYNLPTLRTDPNVREFWGRSLDSTWMNLFESEGGLGGAIWGYIDETFMMPKSIEGFNDWWGIQEIKGGEEVYRGPTIGYGEWGIIDTWRRKKPEFWNTKKAYSPTKILVNEITEFKKGREIILPVYNRFDHTNFSEIKIKWEYNSSSGIINSADIEPHEKGSILIPGCDWESAGLLNIKFYNYDDSFIDEYNIKIGITENNIPDLKPGNLKVIEENDCVVLSGKHYSAKLNKSTGLLEDVISNNDTLIKSGPYLNILVFDKGDWATVPFFDKAVEWKLDNTSYSIQNGIITIISKGYFDDSISVSYNIRIDESGLLKVDYSALNTPAGKLIRESGLKFKIGKEFEMVNWNRDSYWSAYPDYHLGMPIGNINLNDWGIANYKKFPNHLWEKDINDFYYQGIEKKLPLSKIALSTKEYIYFFGLSTKSGSEIMVQDSGKKACRIDKTDDGYNLYITDKWDYASLKWGNYQKNINFKSKLMGSATLKIQ